ncbi:MAG: hypothetical protein LBU03_03260 [Tannerellaceae bacterium]|nr:hypothetical protein [Tannerellaceae bacterium]
MMTNLICMCFKELTHRKRTAVLLLAVGISACSGSLPDVTPPATFDAYPNAFFVDMESEVRSLSITSLVADTASPYLIEALPDWLTVSNDPSGLLLLRFAENESSAERSGLLRLRQTVSGRTLDIPVKQRVIIFPDIRVDVPVPNGAPLAFAKDFRSVGYGNRAISAVLVGHTRDGQLTSDSRPFLYVEDFYDSQALRPLTLTYSDAAVFFNEGYLLFNTKTARNGEAAPSLEISDVASVSVLRFSLSAESAEGKGLALYSSVADGTFELTGLFRPEGPEPQEYTVAVNAGPVAFRFAPVGKTAPIRMHRLEAYTVPFEHDGSLFVDEDFSSWGSLGYAVSPALPPERWLLAAAAQMTSLSKEVKYPKWRVSYAIDDGGVHPDGYIALQAPIYYACGGHVSWARVEMSELPSVSEVEFTFAYSPDNVSDVHGIALCKKTPDDKEWVKLDVFNIDGTDEQKVAGKTIRVSINEDRVRLAFVAAFPLRPDGTDPTPTPDPYTLLWYPEYGEILPVNTSGQNRNVRITNLKIKSIKR